MTTWTGNKANERRTDYLGKTVQKTYAITGVAGNTGGTLTCTGLKSIDNCVVSAYTASAEVASKSSIIVGNTVVVSYVDPNADHWVRVTVFGTKG